jgi:hypothetical protein
MQTIIGIVGCVREMPAGADRYCLLVGEGGVESVGDGVGLLPDYGVHHHLKVQKLRVGFWVYLSADGTREVRFERVALR